MGFGSQEGWSTTDIKTYTWFLVHPASKMHWATWIHHLLISSAAFCTSSHPIPIFLRSLLMTPLQFWCGRPGLLLKPSGSQWWACHGILWHSMRERCPSHLSHLHLIMSCNLVSPAASLTFSFVVLSFQKMPRMLRCHLWCADSSFFIWVTETGHNSALYSNVERTSDWFSCSSIFWE